LIVFSGLSATKPTYTCNGINKPSRNGSTTDLSGGEKQRVAIIIGLMLDRPVLLLDEPTSALDKQSKQILKDILTDLQKTIVFISHEDILLDVADATVQLGGDNG
jgi:putative ABC transport system ATP-binding protein